MTLATATTSLLYHTTPHYPNTLLEPQPQPEILYHIAPHYPNMRLEPQPQPEILYHTAPHYPNMSHNHTTPQRTTPHYHTTPSLP